MGYTTNETSPALSRYFPFSCQLVLAPSQPVKGLAHQLGCVRTSLGELGRTRVAPCNRLRSTLSCARNRFRGRPVVFPLRRVGAKSRCYRVFDNGVSRARYFNPNTGRFWTADEDGHGDQEDPLTLHKYLYCLANPVNNRDPSGNEVEMSLGSLDMSSGLAGMRTTAIGSSPSAFLSSSPYGHGGPDVTATLKRTLNDMGDFFDALRPEERKHESGRYIAGLKAGDSWDIHDLHALEPGEDGINVLSFPGLMPKSRFECGTGQFKATVAVNGEVYYAGAVNYAAYGKMNSLVHDWLKSKGDPVDAAWYSLTATQARVRFFKRFFHREFSSESGATAEAFTAWGYNGTSLPRGLPTSSSREVVNANKFEWKWMPYHP
jgi:hypothetical protein